MRFSNFQPTSKLIAVAVAVAIVALTQFASAQTSFTYQGELKFNGSPADGLFQMEFQLWNSGVGGAQLDSMTINNVDVAAGRFSVELDFGSTTFNLPNELRWLQVEVNGNTLAPRSKITHSPYALQTRGISVNEDATFVGIGRDTQVTPFEIFGLYHNTDNFAGMYVDTATGGSPFYGYSAAGDVKAYHYFDDTTDTWNLYVGADRLKVEEVTGNMSMPGRLGVGGDAGFGQITATADHSLSAYALHALADSDTFPAVLVDNDGAGGAIWLVGNTDASLTDGGNLVSGDQSSLNIVFDNNEIMARDNGESSILHLNAEGGNVRIGQNAGDNKLITPVLQITGGSDFSEMFDVGGKGDAKPGMVVVIDPNNPGRLIPSTAAYDRKVAGIISGAGGVATGMTMGHDGTIADGEYPVALTGRVYCMVDASDAGVEPGDMLTTSATTGHAMKATDLNAAQGAIIGKAMTSLEQGQTGLVLVLVNLQ